MVKDLYEFIQAPYCVIASEDVSNTFPVRSMRSIVVIIDIGSNGDRLLMPVEITANREVNGRAIDVNVLSSAYKKTQLPSLKKQLHLKMQEVSAFSI